MNKRILKAIIANLMDQLEDIDDEPNLSPPQLEVANEAREEIRDAGDWQFDDASPDYNLHVVRQFIHRQCTTGTTGELYLLVGEKKLEEFVQQIHKELVR